MIALPVVALNGVGIGIITGYVPRFFNQWAHNQALGDWFYKFWVYFLIFIDAMLLWALMAAT